MIDVRGQFYFTEPDGLVTTRITLPDSDHLSGTMNTLELAPCENGLLVESRQHGVLRVTTRSVHALHEPPRAHHDIRAIVADPGRGEFMVLERVLDPHTYTQHHALHHHTSSRELLATYDPEHLMGIEVNSSMYNVGLAMNQTWLVLTHQNKAFIHRRDDLEA